LEKQVEAARAWTDHKSLAGTGRFALPEIGMPMRDLAHAVLVVGEFHSHLGAWQLPDSRLHLPMMAPLKKISINFCCIS
jgi:hypothetical protein